MLLFEEEQQQRGKRRRTRNNLGMGTSSVATDDDQFGKLPDELAAEILSRSGMTLNDAARCSSLFGKRWRYMWRLIDYPVLNFDKSDDDDDDNTPEAQRRFVDRVDQAIGLVQRSETKLEGLRLGFKLLKMEEAGWRWIQFGLAERVKQLALLSYMPRSCYTGHFGVPVPLFTPGFLRKQDLTRLEVLEFRDLSKIPRGTMDHIFAHCPSLRQLSLEYCTFHDKDTVISVRHPKLQRLSFSFRSVYQYVSRIEILSAPSLGSLEVRGDLNLPPIEFVGDDIAQLEEFRFCDQGLYGLRRRSYFPWSRAQFDKFAPRLQFLKCEIIVSVIPYIRPPVPKWLLFEKLAVFDLSVYVNIYSTSMLDCAILLRAAPMLRRLSISFINVLSITSKWDRTGELPIWKHHSLQVFQLHGVHPMDKGRVGSLDPRKPELELAANIIMNSPSLNQVLIDTKSLTSNASREPHQIDALIAEARMELESRLHSHTATSQIQFTYQ